MNDKADLKQLFKRVNRLEKELEVLKLIYPRKGIIISLRGIAKLKVSEEELDKSIEEAKRSLFRNHEL